MRIKRRQLKNLIRQEIKNVIKESRYDRMQRISALYEPKRREREAALKKVYRRRPGRNKTVQLTIVTKDQASSDEEALKVAKERINPGNIYPYGDFDYVGYDMDDELHVISYSVDEF